MLRVQFKKKLIYEGTGKWGKDSGDIQTVKYMIYVLKLKDKGLKAAYDNYPQ